MQSHLENLLEYDYLWSVYHEARIAQHGILAYSLGYGGRELMLGAAAATAEALDIPLIHVTVPALRNFQSEFLHTSQLCPRAIHTFTPREFCDPELARRIRSEFGPFVLSLNFDTLPRHLRAKSSRGMQRLMNLAALRFFSVRISAGVPPAQAPLRWRWGRFVDDAKQKKIYGGFRANETTIMRLKPSPDYYLGGGSGDLIERADIPIAEFVERRDRALQQLQAQQHVMATRYYGKRG